MEVRIADWNEQYRPPEECVAGLMYVSNEEGEPHLVIGVDKEY